jgi:hypothetical protein
MGNKETTIFENIRDVFTKNRIPVKGDEGVLQDILTFFSSNDTTDGLKHNIFVKVRVVEVYQKLVEIEVIEVVISDSASECVIDLITSSVPKFVKPKNINWKIK